MTKSAVEEGETQTSYSTDTIEHHLSVIKEVHSRIEEIEVNLPLAAVIHVMANRFSATFDMISICV